MPSESKPQSLDDYFAQFGSIERVALTKIQTIGARRLTEAWSGIPQVTHHDNIDVTDVESWRVGLVNSREKLTLLSLVSKAAVQTLKQYPRFNASFDPARSELILKRFINLGFAIDTDKGLWVGVVRASDVKSVGEIGAEITTLATRARDKGLSVEELSGGSFTISSLGGSGGTYFTPIVNAPEVAILGISAIQIHAAPGPTGEVLWRKMLPISLSYDHRVINGADAARFVSRLKENLLLIPSTPS
jgi:pyruvate dehydrogenase E2 component (dihydrolipoamide acetyltransferase)